MENTEKKKSILFKELDVVFVYLIIFFVGMVIVFGMTSYLNTKVKEFNEESATISYKG